MRRLSVNQSLKARSWMMGAVNVVLLVLLVWTFTAVCEADYDITSKCEDVTAHVGNKINLTCTVSYLNKKCCVKSYKFDETAAYDEEICKEEPISDPCKQESRFSCPYTADKAMTTKFKFFLQTTCGTEETYFNVSTTGAVKEDTVGLAGGSNTPKDKPEITIKCEDVTAHVGDKINLNCTVSILKEGCCMIMYKFINTAEYQNIKKICKEKSIIDPCKQESRFSCSYTANKAITTKVQFFWQTNCSAKTADFSVITTGAVDTGGTNTLTYEQVLAVIIPVIICLIIIIMWFILKKKLNFSTCGFHRNYDTEVSERNISLYSDRETVEQ
nr:uncharacterized protein LOC129421345 isoform X2 [Misgurnus anguillicaudatus]